MSDIAMTGIEAPPRRLTPALRASRLRMTGLLSGLLVAGAFANPLRPLPIDLCGFRMLTGLPCPTCGLTRALCRAIQGDLAGSLAMHPAGVIVLAGVLAWMSWSLLEVWRGQPLWESGQRSAIRFAAVLASVVTIAFWISEL